jgi:hypothetical protein
MEKKPLVPLKGNTTAGETKSLILIASLGHHFLIILLIASM